MSKRVWTYTRERWVPEHRWRPSRGGDEWGRRTIVLPIPFSGYVCWAYRRCNCSDCDQSRAQSAAFEAAYPSDFNVWFTGVDENELYGRDFDF